MEKLIVSFDALDGKYTIEVDIKENITYVVDSSIEYIPSKEGELLKENRAQFLNKLNESNLIYWDKEYTPTGSKIADSVKWRVIYRVKDKEYCSIGEEGYWPYNYDVLIDDLSMLDENIKCFNSNQK